MSNASNPNNTSGRATNSQVILSYPVSEQLEVGTMMRFTSYSRFKPVAGVTEQTTSIIFLPLPMSLRDITDISTGSTDLGALGTTDLSHLNAALDLGSLEPLKKGWELGVSTVTNSLNQMSSSFKVSALKGLALNPMMPDGTRRNASLLAGVIQNPHTNVIFNGVNLKRHTLSWRLSARDERESEVINQMIRTIKTRIHPPESFTGYALDYPDTIHVTFTGGAQKYLPLMRKGMVTSFEANMTNGEVALYTSLAPVSYDISISFQEIDIITRDVLEEVYSDGESAQIIT